MVLFARGVALSGTTQFVGFDVGTTTTVVLKSVESSMKAWPSPPSNANNRLGYLRRNVLCSLYVTEGDHPPHDLRGKNVPELFGVPEISHSSKLDEYWLGKHSGKPMMQLEL
jgi:hypothetical protein